MKSQTEALEHASVRQYCKTVRVPAIAVNSLPLAEQAAKENHSHIRYLEALLAMESEERDRHAIDNRVRDAQLPRMKTHPSAEGPDGADSRVCRRGDTSLEANRWW